MHQRVQIVSVGKTLIGKLKRDSTDLAHEAVQSSLRKASMKLRDIDAFIAMPSLSSPHFMQAHYLATQFGLFRENPNVIAQTIDAGGASPISAIGAAMNLFRRLPQMNSIMIVSSDAVHTMPPEAFRVSSDESIPSPYLPSPRIPHGYDMYAQWQMQKYGLGREQLAMVPVIMSAMAARHPEAMCRSKYSLEEVLFARPIAPVTTVKECARRADGAVALLLCREEHWKSHTASAPPPPEDVARPYVRSVGEGSGPIHPPKELSSITPELFSCHKAANAAYAEAGMTAKDIQFFGLYDCFPICFIRALEAVGLCKEGEGGAMVEAAYRAAEQNGGVVDPQTFPINTHGGLMCYGAPWEVPAMYNVVEAIEQMSGAAGARQIHPAPRRSLVYGNGGVFSASAVAILSSDAP